MSDGKVHISMTSNPIHFKLNVLRCKFHQNRNKVTVSSTLLLALSVYMHYIIDSSSLYLNN